MTSKSFRLGSSLESFLRTEHQHHKHMTTGIATLLRAMAEGGKATREAIVQAGLATDSRPGPMDTVNASGDRQQKLDLLAHDIWVSTLANTRAVCSIISEEAVNQVELHTATGLYIVAIDPLDGSSNVPVNAPAGTIFSIYQRLSPLASSISQAEVLQPGRRQVAAGYLLYGTSMLFVYATADGVHQFTYDPSSDTFKLTQPGLRLPPGGYTYAINGGYYEGFPTYVQQYIQRCRSQGMGVRYTGALVADFHRHLLQGGIYLYPPTRTHPRGKLRLMFEGNAMAFIAEQAGGMAINGVQPTLDIIPTDIHERTSLYVGSAHMVRELSSLATHQTAM
ncbi:MAG: class 1 fructose-bisphosphatase [Bacteroidota bacterium]